MAHHRVLRDLSVAEGGAFYVRFRGCSASIKAKVLDLRCDGDGGVSYALLDRLVHEESDSFLEFRATGSAHSIWYAVSGCYVSEWVRLSEAPRND